MEPSIYSYSLCVALPLMLFFGFYFLFAKTPEKVIFDYANFAKQKAANDRWEHSRTLGGLANDRWEHSQAPGGPANDRWEHSRTLGRPANDCWEHSQALGRLANDCRLKNNVSP